MDASLPLEDCMCVTVHGQCLKHNGRLTLRQRDDRISIYVLFEWIKLKMDIVGIYLNSFTQLLQMEPEFCKKANVLRYLLPECVLISSGWYTQTLSWGEKLNGNI